VLLIVGWEAVNGCIIEGASIFETYQRVAESKRLVTIALQKERRFGVAVPKWFSFK